MILIPEIETVFIRVPRTGSRAFKEAILAEHPRAVEIYHHMEADGTPHGYDRWTKVGVVRNPAARLWSLYHYLSNPPAKAAEAWRRRMIASVAGKSFIEWLRTNETPFTNPYDSAGSLRFDPLYAVLHNMPENRKSQYLYLRPDLGTAIYRYENPGEMADLRYILGIQTPKLSNCSGAPPFVTSAEISDFVVENLSWDVIASESVVRKAA